MRRMGKEVGNRGGKDGVFLQTHMQGGECVTDMHIIGVTAQISCFV